MACRAQIQHHVGDIMEARNKMKEAEDPLITKLRRLELLSEATDLIHETIKNLGALSNLTALRDECYDRFLEACGDAPSPRTLKFGERPECLE